LTQVRPAGSLGQPPRFQGIVRFGARSFIMILSLKGASEGKEGMSI